MMRLDRFFIFFLAVAAGLLTSQSKAQEAVPDSVRKALVDSIVSPRQDWQTASLQGKLRMHGLPLTPSVKIFMERDSSLMISLRAPFMGEVGRAEIMGDTLTVVNKMKKTYVRESLDSVLAKYPASLGMVQDLLLGRVIVPPYGALSAEADSLVTIYPEAEDRFSLVPSEGHEIEGFNYGYLIGPAALPEMLVVTPESIPDVRVMLVYDFREGGYDFSVVYEKEGRGSGGTLQLDKPIFEGDPIEPIRLDGRYRKMNLSDFMKSF